MDSFEFNKIMGAILGTCLALLSINITAGAIFTPQKPEKPGYIVAVPDTAKDQAPGGPPAADEPIEKRLAAATVERGEISARKCVACHTFNKGEPNRVGPNLWGVIGRQVAGVPGFNFSAAMKGKGGAWTLDVLDAYLKNPRGVVPGTTMSFAGVPRASERADLITFLNAKSDNPAPLPKAAQAAPALQGLAAFGTR